MANPRQRSKARSHKSHGPSSNAKRRLHHKLRKAPPLKGPEVLQKGWDKKKTVFQNYAALGLLPSIPIPQTASSSTSQRVQLDLPIELEQATATATATAPVKAKAAFGKIIRDEQGNVIDIILDDDEDDGSVEEQDEGMGVEDDDDVEGEVGKVEAKTDVVRELEALAATSAPVIRHSSTSERTWLTDLVNKYNDDYESMTRDRKLNVWQKTQGEIKRAIKKAGGVEKLRQH